MKFLIYSGSARDGNFTQYVAQFVFDLANDYPDLQVDLISPKNADLKFEGEGEQAKKSYPDLTQKVVEADGYILVSPEYNHGYPGSLKYMLDLHLKEYVHKPVAFVGVSSGAFGGTRVIEALLNVVRELGMVATHADVNVSSVQNEIQNGKFKEPEKWEKRVKRMLDELVWMAQALKYGRENL